MSDKNLDLLRAERDELAVRLRRASKNAEDAELESSRLRASMRDIATRPTFEPNPDGDDQAAYTMQAIAREALDATGEEEWPQGRYEAAIGVLRIIESPSLIFATMKTNDYLDVFLASGGGYSGLRAIARHYLQVSDNGC